MRQNAEFSRNAAGVEPLVGDAAALCESSLRIFRGTRGSVAHPAGQPIHLERVARDRVTGIELSDSSRDKPGRSEESERPPTRRSTAASLYAYSGNRRGNQDVCRRTPGSPHLAVLPGGAWKLAFAKSACLRPTNAGRQAPIILPYSGLPAVKPLADGIRSCRKLWGQQACLIVCRFCFGVTWSRDESQFCDGP